MADYVTSAEFKTYATITGTTDDTVISAAITSASRAIESVCCRYFTQDASTSARVYDHRSYPGIISRFVAYVHDISTTTGLAIKTDTGDDGTYETTWAATDYQLEPLNGIVDGITGHPYTRIRAVGDHLFPTGSLIAPLEVTAKWGWAAVPAPVKQACFVLTESLFKLKDTPFGVAGFDQFGAVRVRENPYVMTLLGPYLR